MARGTSGTDTQISGTYTSHKNLTYFSMGGWMRRATAGSVQTFGFTATSSARSEIWHHSDNNVYVTLQNGVNSYSQNANNVTGWHHWAIVFDGSQSTNATRLKLFYDGAQRTLSFVGGNVPASTSNNVNAETFRIGRNTAAGVWSTGDFAEIAWWDAALSANDIGALADGFAPDKVRPDGLLAYLPLVRNIQDVVTATTLTDQSTTIQPHPRVYA